MSRPVRLELPLDRLRPPVPFYARERVEAALSAKDGERFSATATGLGITPGTAVLALFQAVLLRHSGQDQAWFAFHVRGVLHDAQPSREDDPTVTEWMRRMADALGGRGATVETTPFDTARAVGIVESDDPDDATLGRRAAESDLTLWVRIDAAGFLLKLEFDAEILERATARALLDRLMFVLAGWRSSSDPRLSALRLAPADGEEARRAVWPAWRGPSPTERLEQTWARQVERGPRRRAVQDRAGVDWTYSDLDAWANRLARVLAQRGVGPGSRVAIFLERSGMVPGVMLAILKAGAVYVPVDLAYPVERIAMILEDAAPAGIVTTDGLLARLPETRPRATLLDRDAPTIDAQSPTRPSHDAGPGEAAYVMYTSGSTGRPKGVEVTHANVQRLFRGTEDWCDFAEDDVWLAAHSFAFDMSVLEVWGALLHGARLVVAAEGIARCMDDLHELIAREGVTRFSITPSALRSFILADSTRDRLTTLRSLIVGGEKLDFSLLRPWFERYPDDAPRVINTYGPTETTVYALYRMIERGDLDIEPSRIGRPLSDVALSVVDSAGRIVPRGVPGELVIGGAGVANGYLGRDALTAERFVADPLDRAARAYRSGDLVRFRYGGEFEFLGRIDQQVKLRGYRIEPSEIEAALSACPGVVDARVVLWGDGADACLVAYVVAESSAATEPDSLRRQLEPRLPAYMIPAAFVRLAAIPLNAQGKFDHRALPDPFAAQGATGETPRAPASEAERRVAATFARVLGVDAVVRSDNFFALGGDSLRATRLAHALSQEFDCPLSTRSIFDCPTVEALLDHLLQRGAVISRA